MLTVYSLSFLSVCSSPEIRFWFSICSASLSILRFSNSSPFFSFTIAWSCSRGESSCSKVYGDIYFAHYSSCIWSWESFHFQRRYYVLIMQFLLLLFRLYCILSGTAPYMLCSFCCARVNFSNSTAGSRQMINISSLAAGLPMLNLTGLMSEVNQTLVRLGSFLQAPTLIQDALPIAVIDWYVSVCSPLFLCYFSLYSSC